MNKRQRKKRQKKETLKKFLESIEPIPSLIIKNGLGMIYKGKIYNCNTGEVSTI